MTSATPIFEQLCRDFFATGKTQSAEDTQPQIISQPKAPAHSLENTESDLAYAQGSHLPPALAEWARPAG